MCAIIGYLGNAKGLKDFEKEFSKIRHRGPDFSQIKYLGDEATLGFHRLSIMDTSGKGNQPFTDESEEVHLICNGEIYNYKQLRKSFCPAYAFASDSDCEVILPLYQKFGIEKATQFLDAEFAVIIYDKKTHKLLAARDAIGIRPLFYGYTKTENKIMFASEAKSLVAYCAKVHPFPPGHYYDGDGNFVCFRDITSVNQLYPKDEKLIVQGIREKLVEGVRKRLMSDVPVGFLLSGGVDSSLVCSIASRILKQPITTFSVGIDKNPIDTHYAQIVADFLGANHHEVIFTEKQAIDILPKLIYHLETWDITTIRASIGMYLVSEYVKLKTPIKVLLTGEVSDELFGYKYTDFAPNAQEFQKEAVKRIKEIYIYDVLRADRSICAHGLEARVPFSDIEFVEYVMAIPADLKMNSNGMGKYLLRKAFDCDNYLPKEILYRDKAAFSDAVGHRMVDCIKEYAETAISDSELKNASRQFSFGTPFTKESLLYRKIFEGHFPGHATLIKDFWMPNKNWDNCNVTDPSARVLPNYGNSGANYKKTG